MELKLKSPIAIRDSIYIHRAYDSRILNTVDDQQITEVSGL